MESPIFGFLGVIRDSKWDESRLKDQKSIIKFNDKLALTALHSAA